MKRLRSLLAGLLAWTLFVTPALAAWPPTIVEIGQHVETTNIATTYAPTTADAPVGTYIFVGYTLSGAPATTTFSDSSGNTYNTTSVCTFNTTNKVSLVYAKVTTDMPAPVTATGSISTVGPTVAFTTDPGTLVVGQVITGAGVTTSTAIAGGISQWNGSAASATINNSQTVASETLTISSGIKLVVSTALKTSIAAFTSTDIATASALDVSASCQSGTSTSTVQISPAVTTGTMAQDNELVIGAVGIVSGYSAYSSHSPFTDLTGTTTNNPNVAWGRHATTTGTSAGDTFAPSWTTARAYGAGAWTFKSSGSAGVTCRGALLLLGVGGC